MAYWVEHFASLKPQLIHGLAHATSLAIGIYSHYWVWYQFRSRVPSLVNEDGAVRRSMRYSASRTIRGY